MIGPTIRSVENQTALTSMVPTIFGRMSRTVAALLLLAGIVSCGAVLPEPAPRTLNYVGSSTVARFLRDASVSNPSVRFRFDTAPESLGGERAIAERRCELAGTADIPSPETMRGGVRAVHFGNDAIAVIVHSDNPLHGLSSEQLRAVFTGEVGDWAELGGASGSIRPLVTAADSATHRVFRRVVLGGTDYAGCEVVQPDEEIVARVAADRGAIGQISFAFLPRGNGVRALAVDGTTPTVTNFDYPIVRPLYLLAHAGNPTVDRFLDWVLSDVGQQVVMKQFVGLRVVASIDPGGVGSGPKGRLIVRTDTEVFYDGGVHYYPHRPYEICTPHGEHLRRVRNHRGQNDENPERVELEPGVYLVRTVDRSGETIELFVTIQAGRTTDVDVNSVVEGADG